jgi:hypothetical protein
MGSDGETVKPKVAGHSGNDVDVHTDKNQVNAVDDIFNMGDTIHLVVLKKN